MSDSTGGVYVDLQLPVGTHHYMFIVDGRWILDPSNTHVSVTSHASTHSHIHCTHYEHQHSHTHMYGLEYVLIMCVLPYSLLSMVIIKLLSLKVSGQGFI